MYSPEYDDASLVARAQAGELWAFEALVRRYEKYVYNLAYRVLGDATEAEDLAQQAFYRAWRGLQGFRSRSQFSTWLYRIVTNLCYNRLPALKHDLTSLVADEEALELPDERPSVEAGLISEEIRAQLYRAIEGLPKSYRLLITLRHLQEMSYDEIALATALPLGTVKTGIFRARRMLKDALEEAGPGDARP